MGTAAVNLAGVGGGLHLLGQGFELGDVGQGEEGGEENGR